VTNSWSREPNLDFLRTFAVACVVVRHIVGFFSVPSSRWFQPQALGIYGVLLFFVHTSLVLMMSLKREVRRGEASTARLYGAFLMRRFFRIYPLSVTTVTVVYLFLIPHADATSVRSGIAVAARFEDFVANLFLVQDLVGRDSVIAPLWSLPAEVQMYLLLPLLFLSVERYGPRSVAFLWWPVSVVVAMLAWKLNLPITAARYAPCFVAGVLCYGTLRTRRPLPFALFPGVILAALVAYMAAYARIGLQAGLGILVTLMLGTAIPFFAPLSTGRFRRACHAIAKYSYGIYLFHTPCIWISFGRGHWLGIVGSSVCFILLVFGTSFVTYHFIEEPFIRVGQILAERIASRSIALRTPILPGS
jgi:peptidoglycan/LPS O-acetylase OafA/YrhL